MHRLSISVAAILLAATSSVATAACPKDLVCADDPQTVVTALTNAGYRAKLGTDKTGDPTIESAAAGYTFDIYFYGCKDNKACNSVQFRATFTADDAHTPEYANKWNVEKRFLQMSVRDDKSLALSYDLSTTGGINAENFADTIDWWAVMLGEATKFFAAPG